jgi:predicted amidohydrolase YtcJ
VKISRRAFLKASCGAAAATVLGKSLDVVLADEPRADLALTHAAIVTMDDKVPAASAMTVRGGKILAVGDEKSLATAIAGAAQVIDLKGKGVSPGLIDAHSHLMAFGHMEKYFVNLRPPKVHSFSTLGNILAATAAKTPRGQWIVGRGFQEFDEGHYPTRKELDEYVPNHPVQIIQWSGQFGIANTLALKEAKLLDASAKDPYGGKFLRDADGVPNGILIHYPAIYAVYQSELPDRQESECIEWAAKQFIACGVTCVHDNFTIGGTIRNYVELDRAGKLPLRVRIYPYVASVAHAQTLLSKMKRYQGKMARIQGVKLAVDGYAMMYDIPERYKQIFLPMHPQDQFQEIVSAIHRADYQVDVHAAGDKGVDWTLDAFSKAAGGDRQVRSRRHRIEHYMFRKADSIQRTADMGVPVCTQPDVIRVRGDDLWNKFDPQQRKLVMSMIPMRTFHQAGVALAIGADVPAFPSYRPLDSLRSAMERKTDTGRQLDESECVSFLDALKDHTIQGAWASFDENDLGSLTPGKLADFAVWNSDLRTIKTANDLAKLRVTATFVGGKKVYG